MWIGNSPAEELDHLVEVLDNEFVIGKGYHLSLTKRFPRTLNIENLSNIYVLKDAGKLLSSVVVKNFDWIVQDYKWKCAMIGMVYTIPEARGQGFSTNLMKYVQEQLLAREVDFAVLFTSIPEFYLRLGWLQRDIGVWGCYTQENDNSDKAQNKIAPIPINQKEIDYIELIRSQRCRWYIPRNFQDYLTLPRPSEYVKLLLDGDKLGYALFGGFASTAYVYEMFGTEETFQLIWNSLLSQYHTVYINDYKGSASQEWLMVNAKIPWKMQQMTMWLYISARSLSLQNQNLPVYVPYFDRI